MNESFATVHTDSDGMSILESVFVESPDITTSDSNSVSVKQSDDVPAYSRDHDTKNRSSRGECNDGHEGVPYGGDTESSSDDIICWICHGDNNTADNPLGQYCQCTLRSTQVHKLCIERWVFAYHHSSCATCNTSYNIVQPKADEMMPSITTWFSRQVVLLRFFFLPLLRAASIPTLLLVFYLLVLPCSIGGLYFVAEIRRLLSGLEEQVSILYANISSSIIRLPLTLLFSASRLLILSFTSLDLDEFPVLLKAWMSGVGHILLAVWLRREWHKYLKFVQTIVHDYTSSIAGDQQPHMAATDDDAGDEDYTAMYNILGDSIAHVESNPVCFSEIEHSLHYLRRLRQQLVLPLEAWFWLGCVLIASMLLVRLLCTSTGRAMAIVFVLLMSVMWRWLWPPQPTPPIYSYRGKRRAYAHAHEHRHPTAGESNGMNSSSNIDSHNNHSSSRSNNDNNNHNTGEGAYDNPPSRHSARRAADSRGQGETDTAVDATETFTAQLLYSATTAQHVRIFTLHIFRYIFFGPLPLTLGFVIERALAPYFCTTRNVSFLATLLQPLTPQRAMFHWVLGMISLATRQVIHLSCIDLLFSRKCFVGVFRIVGFDFKRTTLDLLIHMYTHSDLLQLIGYFVKEWCGLIVFFYGFFSVFVWVTFHMHSCVRRVIGEDYFHALSELPLPAGFPASYPRTIDRAGTLEGWIQHQQMELWLSTLLGFMLTQVAVGQGHDANTSLSAGAVLESFLANTTPNVSGHAKGTRIGNTDTIYHLEDVPLADNTRSPLTRFVYQIYASLVYGDESDHGIIYTLFGMVPPDAGGLPVAYTAALTARTKQTLCAATLTETALWTQWNSHVVDTLQRTHYTVRNSSTSLTSKMVQRNGATTSETRSNINAAATSLSDETEMSICYSTHFRDSSNDMPQSDGHTSATSNNKGSCSSSSNNRFGATSEDALNVRHLIMQMLKAREYIAQKIYNEEDVRVLAGSWRTDISQLGNSLLLGEPVRDRLIISGQPSNAVNADYLTFDHPIGCAALGVLTAARPFFILRPFAWFIATFLIRYSSLIVTVYNVTMLVLIVTCLISISFLLDPYFVHLALRLARLCVKLNFLDEAIVFDRTKLAWIETYTVPRSLEDLDIFVTDEDNDAGDAIYAERTWTTEVDRSASPCTTRDADVAVCTPTTGTQQAECQHGIKRKYNFSRGILTSYGHFFPLSPSWVVSALWKARLFLFSFTYLFSVGVVISLVPILCMAFFLFFIPYSIPLLIAAMTYSFSLLDSSSFVTTACGLAVAVVCFLLSPLFILHKFLSLFWSFSSNKIAQGALNYHYGVRCRLMPIRPVNDTKLSKEEDTQTNVSSGKQKVPTSHENV